MTVSGEQHRDQSSQNSPPIRAAHNTEQSFLPYTVGPCWLSILNIALYIYLHPIIVNIICSHTFLVTLLSHAQLFLPALYPKPLEAKVLVSKMLLEAR